MIAFLGTLAWNTIVGLIFWQWTMKMSYEILVIRLTYLVTGYLKRVENEDYYDYKTNFNPFRLKVENQ